jgi:hypothetical protein
VVVAEELPPVPAAVLAEAAAVNHPRPAPPSAEAIAVADQVDVLLARADVLLAVRDPVAAGERFVAAVALLEPMTKADRRALGSRYRAQRQHLALIANQLLLDPAIAGALGPAESVPPAAPAQPAAPIVGTPTP